VTYGYSTATETPTRRARQLTIAWLSLFGLVAVVALFVFITERDRDELTAATARRAQEQALLQSEHAARLFEAAEVSLSTVVEDVAGMDWEQVAQSRTLWRRVRALAAGLPYVEAFWLCSDDGRLRLTSLAFPAPPIDTRARDFFVRHQAGAQEIVVGDPVAGAGGRPTFRLSRRLETALGSFRGIAAATIEIDYFNRLYARLGLPPGSVVTLFRADDLVPLISVAMPGAPAPRPIFDADALRRAIASNPELGSMPGPAPVEKDSRTIAYREVPGFPLYVEVAIPLDSMRPAWMRMIETRSLTAAAAILALAVLTAMALRQARRERAFQDELARGVAERTAALEAANLRLEALLRELHHRVNNNLQTIESLLTLSAGRMRDPAARAVLAPNIGRIHTIGVVHRTVYATGEPTELPFSDLLRSLVDQLADIYGAAADIRITGANPRVDLDMAVPLALIVHELLSNVLRHAYPEGAPRADIRITEGPDDWTLEISDSGIGLPAGFDLTEAEGLGLTIVRLLAARIGGRITVDSLAGTRFALCIPFRRRE